jgi:hypothetical protein
VTPHLHAEDISRGISHACDLIAANHFPLIAEHLAKAAADTTTDRQLLAIYQQAQQIAAALNTHTAVRKHERHLTAVLTDDPQPLTVRNAQAALRAVITAYTTHKDPA